MAVGKPVILQERGSMDSPVGRVGTAEHVVGVPPVSVDTPWVIATSFVSRSSFAVVFPVLYDNVKGASTTSKKMVSETEPASFAAVIV